MSVIILVMGAIEQIINIMKPGLFLRCYIVRLSKAQWLFEESQGRGWEG